MPPETLALRALGSVPFARIAGFWPLIFCCASGGSKKLVQLHNLIVDVGGRLGFSWVGKGWLRSEASLNRHMTANVERTTGAERSANRLMSIVRSHNRCSWAHDTAGGALLNQLSGTCPSNLQKPKPAPLAANQGISMKANLANRFSPIPFSSRPAGESARWVTHSPTVERKQL